jgi:MOSC domain-containing protein YiiM
VYAYPARHYDLWRRELPEAKLPWDAFGENFTTEGLLEDEVWIGDRHRVGTTELVVRQPRMPCYTLGIVSIDPTWSSVSSRAVGAGSISLSNEMGKWAPGV